MYDSCVSSVVHIEGCLGYMMYDRCVSSVVHIVGVEHIVGCLWDVWQVCVLGGAHCVCVEGITV